MNVRRQDDVSGTVWSGYSALPAPSREPMARSWSDVIRRRLADALGVVFVFGTAFVVVKAIAERVVGS